jgi:DNA polymerase/3'-5' exonuclease PolX
VVLQRKLLDAFDSPSTFNVRLLMKLNQARAMAEGLVAQMQPFCHRVEIAGSIRRAKSEVKDIEIVAVPVWELAPVEEQIGNLFANPPRDPGNINKLHFWATKLAPVRWIKPGTADIVDWHVKPEGKYWRGLVNEEIKLDLFLATPENFGLIYLIRTGSADFSQAVVTHALHATNYRVQAGYVIEQASGSRQHTPEEASVFGLFGLAYIEPSARIDARAVRRKQ